MPIKIVKEKTIEDYLCRRIREEFIGAEVLKFEARRGEPDRIILLPGGKTVFVEVKRPGKQPRPEQERALQRKRTLGFVALYANTKEKVEELVEILK